MDNNDFDKYQDFTGTVAIYPPETGLAYTACGLAGEAGEYVGKIADHLDSVLVQLDSNTPNRENLVTVVETLRQAEKVGKEAEKLKKLIRKREMQLPPISEIGSTAREELSKELGDLGWYFSECAKSLGRKLSRVINQNIAKLTSRKERSVLEGNGDNR